MSQKRIKTFFEASWIPARSRLFIPAQKTPGNLAVPGGLRPLRRRLRHPQSFSGLFTYAELR